MLREGRMQVFVGLWMRTKDLAVFRQWRAVALQITSGRFGRREGGSELRNYLGDKLY